MGDKYPPPQYPPPSHSPGPGYQSPPPPQMGYDQQNQYDQNRGFFSPSPGPQQQMMPPQGGQYYGPPGPQYGPPGPGYGYPPQGPPQQVIYQDRQSSGPGICTGILAGLACCCCLDMLC